MTPHEKGIDLETAVQAIEAAILESSPALREKAFTIEFRKRVSVADVRHEIDIFVTVEIATGYASTFIFECKNWEDAVGKNEIIIFSEKIAAVSAQRGYFVAKSFTKDAEAQARKDLRITLLLATEHNPATTIVPSDFHVTSQVGAQCTVRLIPTHLTARPKHPEAVLEMPFHLEGTDIPAKSYFAEWMAELYKKGMGTFNSARLADGVHPLLISERRSFDRGACVIDGISLQHLVLSAQFDVEIFRPAVRSHYEVATRGRVIKLAKATVCDFEIDFSAIEVGTLRIGEEIRVDISPRRPSEKLHWMQEEISRNKNVSIVLCRAEQKKEE